MVLNSSNGRRAFETYPRSLDSRLPLSYMRYSTSTEKSVLREGRYDVYILVVVLIENGLD